MAVRDLRNKRIDSFLPFALLDPGIKSLVRDDAGVMLGERDIDQNAVARPRTAEAARVELLDRRPMRPRPLHGARHQQHADAVDREDEEQTREDRALQEENALG